MTGVQANCEIPKQAIASPLAGECKHSLLMSNSAHVTSFSAVNIKAYKQRACWLLTVPKGYTENTSMEKCVKFKVGECYQDHLIWS